MSAPKLTLKIGGGRGSTPGVNGTPTPGTGTPKIMLKMNTASKPSTPSEPAPAPPQKTKAGRAPKPSAKVMANNKNGKRMKDDSDDEDDMPMAMATPKLSFVPQAKKLKISLGPKTLTVLKAKFKGRPPKRTPGEGYDSEASDKEIDPLIEEEFVLRMMPGDDCEYLRKAIQERTIGLPRNQGGADIQMKFLHADGRRAMITIRGNAYAATLVDLPCVIEGMKSWDKRGWWKSADICQMLLVFAPVKNDAEALTIPLPREVDRQTFQYPHGLTPPMHFARKRRFRNRISRTAIEAVEDAVEKLLEADAKAENIRHEIIEPEVRGRQGSGYGSPDAYGEDEEYSEDMDADAEGDEDDTNNYFSQMDAQTQEQQQDEDDLHADLEADLAAAFEAELDVGTPAAAEGETPVVTVASGTPDATGNVNGEAAGGSSDESIEDDDEEDEEGGSSDVDEDRRAAMEQRQGALEDIAEMEKQIAGLQASWEAQNNPILKGRIKNSIEKVKAELQLKMSAIGEGDED